MLETPAFSELFAATESPMSALRALPHFVRRLDQCMLGAEIENMPIKKATDVQSNVSMGPDVKCDGTHVHLQLRGHGAGGSRTAQAARYPMRMNDLILEFVGNDAPSGGSHIHASLPDFKNGACTSSATA